tara:strand:- start:11694 stop:13046 length:1353 start_codon:yes stop_codon:yes gene_type:complete
MTLSAGNILDAAQSSRLTAIKQTARKLDETSVRLATGLDVNSALDDPQNYFAAFALRNKAADLTRLLDGITQSIRTVELAEDGLQADLKILDQAESYLLDLEQKYRSGEIETQAVQGGFQPTNETDVTFAGVGDLAVYVGSQDSPSSGSITVIDDNQVTFDGNYWRRKAFNYSITPDSVLTFEFRSSLEPEIAAIGFDNDTNFSNGNSHFFFLHGTQTSGITYDAPVATYDYDGSGNWVEVEIPVGTFFTGNFANITFVHDDDALPYGNASYRNITLREGAKQVGPTVEQATRDLASEYIKIVSQIDAIAEDANYRGINLLGGEDLVTDFNRNRTTSLTSKGVDATYNGLGLDVDDFDSIEAVQKKIDQVRKARQTLRRYSATLANNFDVIKMRYDFIRNQISTAKSGADDLTLADQNEEGANMLALQTRQQIQFSILAQPPANILSILS